MVHREAAVLVEENGGRAVQSVSRSLTMLVVGEEGWPLEEDGGTSQKLVRAAELIAEGAELRIVAESDWLHLIGLNERRDEIQRAYTPAMLSRLLGISVRLIRRWSRIGLIRPVRRVCRLPYFDFREVASAQRLAKLLDDGVSPEKLEQSLLELSSNLAGTDRSLAQLTLLVRDEKVVMRDEHGVLNPRTGQRLLDFEETGTEAGAGIAIYHPDADSERPQSVAPPDPASLIAADSETSENSGSTGNQAAVGSSEGPVAISFMEARLRLDDRSMSDWTADEWFHEGCRLTEEASFESAINAFRNCLTLLASELVMVDAKDRLPPESLSTVLPDPADVNFHLADALYRCGRTDAAIERYHCAIEFAPDFIEAWTQLGCLQAERQQWLAAEEALVTAISIHSGNPDALLHYAQLLDQTDRAEDAARYWEQYLQHDSRGPWADHARQRIHDASQTVDQ
jgi:tetratricopeptide (TPR) repeat protein